MKLALSLAAVMVMSCSFGRAQDAYYYGAYYAPAPVFVNPQLAVVAPAQTVVQMSYVPQPAIVYAVPQPVYLQAPVYAPTVAVAAPVRHSPYSVAARETARATRNGIDYRYREYGPLGGQRYHYIVNSKSHGYVVRERGH